MQTSTETGLFGVGSRQEGMKKKGRKRGFQKRICFDGSLEAVDNTDPQQAQREFERVCGETAQDGA